MSLLYLDFKQNVDQSEGTDGGITIVDARALIPELQEKGTSVNKPIQTISLEHLVGDGTFAFNLMNEFGCVAYEADLDKHPLKEFGQSNLGGTINSNYRHSLSLIPDQEHDDQKCSIREYVEYVCEQITTNMDIAPEDLFISVRNAWTPDTFKGKITYNPNRQEWKSVTLNSKPAPAQP